MLDIHLPQHIEARIKRLGLPGESAHIQMSPSRRPLTSHAKLNSNFNPRLSAVMILLYQRSEEWYNVLIQRPTYNGTHSGQMAFPGGQQESEDLNFEMTALRETEEEIGLSASNIKVLSKLSEIYIPPSNFMVYPFLGICNTPPIFEPQEREVAEIIEYPISKLLTSNIVESTVIKINNELNINVPCFNIKGKVVWGATAAMLNEVRHILQDITP